MITIKNKSKYYEEVSSNQQLRVLLMLELLCGSADRKTLMKYLDMSKSVLTEKTSKLDEKKLIERDGKRHQTIKLTERGKMKVRQFFCDLVKLILFARAEFERCKNCFVPSVHKCLNCRIFGVFKGQSKTDKNDLLQ